jgi:hypothetical protein
MVPFSKQLAMKKRESETGNRVKGKFGKKKFYTTTKQATLGY